MKAAKAVSSIGSSDEGTGRMVPKRRTSFNFASRKGIRILATYVKIDKEKRHKMKIKMKLIDMEHCMPNEYA